MVVPQKTEVELNARYEFVFAGEIERLLRRSPEGTIIHIDSVHSPSHTVLCVRLVRMRQGRFGSDNSANFRFAFTSQWQAACLTNFQ